MHHDHLDMETVTLELDEERLEAVDDLAFKRHRGNREAAIRELLDRWLKESENEREDGVTNASSARTE